jgi:hypothetical protein
MMGGEEEMSQQGPDETLGGPGAPMPLSTLEVRIVAALEFVHLLTS